MASLLLTLAIIALVVIVMRHKRRHSPAQQKKLYWQLAIGAAVALLILGVITGRMHWLGAVAAALIPFIKTFFNVLIRMIPLLQFWQRQQGPSVAKGNASTVATDILQMQLDHDSGEMDGSVLAGPFNGRLLHDLEQAQLLELLRYCSDKDQESQQLLIAYLQRRFGEEAFEQHFSQEEHTEQSTHSAGASMTLDEARQTLGVSENADRDEVVSAHRKLMQKLHPDRGGNDYLAAKVNAAKDVLLKSS